ncbi:MAG: phage portal protein [Rheinheimera sp.]|uniref:phage portal protein n=1 Tax=Arsukibacterium sp. UBA3155 TaxID=1946058 RepID=UPI000C9035AF|nr:phage portal protein [Arsukibacterium sp. UBA3155]MAD75154.1 phage portal protein [Rheinheimera sp.]|tara:strand:- start:37422 stop:38618 length:1197 start_codon:yes stop_codon:yes gene_type:complete
MGLFKRFFGTKNTDIIDSPEKLLALFSSFGMSAAGISITPANAMQIASVFSCVRILAESVGMLPLNLMKQDGRQKVKDSKNDLYWLMQNGPNDYMTAQEFKELIMVHLGLRGNHYSYINRSSTGKVLELLPLAPHCVEPKLKDDWTVEYKVTFAKGDQRTLDANDILHIRLFTLDGLNGLSPISYGRHTMGLAKATETHGSKLFANAARPSGGFKTEKTLTDPQFNRLKDQFNEYSGENALKNLILEGGLEWFQTTMSSEDAQFLETRKYQRSEIFGLFRVPPHMAADLEKATFSNIEHQSLDFVQHSLMPYLTRIEQRCDKDLLKSDKTRYFKFNANALLRGAMKDRAEFYGKLVNLGALSPNDVREYEDMNPREDGDIYLTPSNMLIDGKLPEKPQ